MRALGTALCWLAALLIVPQLVRQTPWQFGVALGVLLLVAGALLIVDSPRRRRLREFRGHRRGRKGYFEPRGDGS